MTKTLSAVRHFALVIAVLLSVGCCFALAQQPNFPALLETLKSDQWTEIYLFNKFGISGGKRQARGPGDRLFAENRFLLSEHLVPQFKM